MYTFNKYTLSKNRNHGKITLNKLRKPVGNPSTLPDYLGHRIILIALSNLIFSKFHMCRRFRGKIFNCGITRVSIQLIAAFILIPFANNDA